MPDAMTPRELLLANLGLVNEVVRFVARRQQLDPEQESELESFVRLRLLEDDFRVLRRFEGRSSLRTYLTIVVQRLWLDYRNHALGRWRASATASRLGPAARLLEELVYRDGFTFAEAAQVIASRGFPIGEAELAELWRAMPLRRPHRLQQGTSDEAREVPDPAPDPETRTLRAEAATRLERVLVAALRELPPTDLLLVHLHFSEGVSLLALSRLWAQPYKGLVRRLDALLRELRRRVRAAGIAAGEAAEVAGALRGNLIGRVAGKSVPVWPSNQVDEPADLPRDA